MLVKFGHDLILGDQNLNRRKRWRQTAELRQLAWQSRLKNALQGWHAMNYVSAWQRVVAKSTENALQGCLRGVAMQSIFLIRYCPGKWQQLHPAAGAISWQ
ncbi:MAG TPA: hypothetical protein VGZ47_12195 [Gemmataceae bacterium]|jgi:hypothetical protein|nr:hypothetical protein [Gemmataceae bacterium]